MATPRPSPYQGLIPFQEEDVPYFFGRTTDIKRITANVQAWRLSIFYGASGVGKTSLIRAGALAGMLSEAKAAIAAGREPTVVPVVFSHWKDDPLVQLKATIAHVVGGIYGNTIPLDFTAEGNLADTLEAFSEHAQSRLVLILDQFEEFFLYQNGADTRSPIARTLVDLLGRTNFATHVMISTREDSLSKLDVFKYEIPNLLDNCLRLEHLDLASAREAVERPLEQWRCDGRGDLSIEPPLVNALIEELASMEVRDLSMRGKGKDTASAPQGDRIEAPLLQMVLQRLYLEDASSGSGILKAATLRSLHGARTITRTHVDRILGALSPTQRLIAASIFDRLVTPTGAKIAQSTADLIRYAREARPSLGDDEIGGTLAKLSDPKLRVLRTVESPADRPDLVRYEIFHDVLAEPILQHVVKTQAAQRAAARRRRIATLAGVALVIVALLYYYTLWVESRPWAFAEELWSGAHRPLTGEVVTMGRDAEQSLRNTIPVSAPVGAPFNAGNMISRFHLIFDKSLAAMDMRSMNGTTLNGRPMLLGELYKVAAGDLIVLAGYFPFRISTPVYGWYQFWNPRVIDRPPPGDAWAVFIDGQTRAVHYLVGSTTHLSLAPDRGFVLNSHSSPEDVATIGLHPSLPMPTIVDRADDRELRGSWKASDYAIVDCPIPPGIPVMQFESGLGCRFISEPNPPDESLRWVYLPSVSLTYGDRHFQVVPLLRSAEANLGGRAAGSGQSLPR